MSENPNAVFRISLLLAEYERKNGVELSIKDFSKYALTEEKVVEVLERMIEQGESLPVAYAELFGEEDAGEQDEAQNQGLGAGKETLP